MKSRPLPVRLRPDYSYQPRAADYLLRAVGAVAHETTFKQSMTAVEFAREEWGDDTTEIILRAATTQATITDPSWAGSLARAATGDFVASLAWMGMDPSICWFCLGICQGNIARIYFYIRS
jgi:hypothetical protein